MWAFTAIGPLYFESSYDIFSIIYNSKTSLNATQY